MCDSCHGDRRAADLRYVRDHLSAGESPGETMTSNVIPFPPRKISESELIAYRMITRGWSEAMKRLLLPAYFAAESKQGRAPSSRADPTPP